MTMTIFNSQFLLGTNYSNAWIASTYFPTPQGLVVIHLHLTVLFIYDCAQSSLMLAGFL